MLISNFVYDKQGATRKKVMQYRHCFPIEQIFTWEEFGHMPKGKYLLMHSLIYRTKLLHGDLNGIVPQCLDPRLD